MDSALGLGDGVGPHARVTRASPRTHTATARQVPGAGYSIISHICIVREAGGIELNRMYVASKLRICDTCDSADPWMSPTINLIF